MTFWATLPKNMAVKATAETFVPCVRYDYARFEQSPFSNTGKSSEHLASMLQVTTNKFCYSARSLTLLQSLESFRVQLPYLFSTNSHINHSLYCRLSIPSFPSYNLRNYRSKPPQLRKNTVIKRRLNLVTFFLALFSLDFCTFWTSNGTWYRRHMNFNTHTAKAPANLAVFHANLTGTRMYKCTCN